MPQTIKKNFLLALTLCLFASDLAAKPSAAVGDPSLHAVVEKVYEERMGAEFVRILNVGKRHPRARDFFAEVARLTNDHPDAKYLAEIFKETDTPKILSIQDGLVMNFGQQKTTIALGSKLGSVLLNGKVFDWPVGKTFRDMVEAEQARLTPNWFDFLIPTAEASPWSVLGRIGLQAAKHFMVGSVVGAAGGAATGAVVACYAAVVQLRSATETPVQACGEGAREAVTVASLTGSVLLGTGFGGIAALDTYDRSKNTDPDGHRSLRRGFGRVIRSFGVLGLLAFGLGAYDEALWSNGAEVACAKDGNGYRISGYKLAKKTEIYATDGSAIQFKNGGQSRSEAEFTANLQNDFKMNAEQAAVVGKSAWEEFQATVKQCRQSPGRTWRVLTSDAKKIPSAPETVK